METLRTTHQSAVELLNQLGEEERALRQDDGVSRDSTDQ